MAKRFFDIFVSFVFLILLLPLLLVVALWIKFDSHGPIFFRQERVGLNGKIFRIHKFRTMSVDACGCGLQITVGADMRVTRSGSFLRKYKVDELPQLIDVLCGEMSLVGPRPEVPRYMAEYPPDVRSKVLSIRPGITDRASIEFRSESDILSAAVDPEQAYIEEILPIKQSFYVSYVDDHSFFGDVKIIIDTVLAVLSAKKS